MTDADAEIAAQNQVAAESEITGSSLGVGSSANDGTAESGAAEGQMQATPSAPPSPPMTMGVKLHAYADSLESDLKNIFTRAGLFAHEVEILGIFVEAKVRAVLNDLLAEIEKKA